MPEAIPVPAEYLPHIEAAAFQYGIPKSWLAAVCSMTGWDPYFETRNIPTMTIRRYGIAGIWARLEDVMLREGNMGIDFGAFCNRVYAGWHTAGPVEAGNQMCEGCFGNLETYRPVPSNISLAANILKQCRQLIMTMCGEENELIFLAWMWGCKWRPWNAVLGMPNCNFPPGTPSIFQNETQQVIQAQRVYAEDFQEPSFGIPPPSVSLSANSTLAPPGSAITFQANVSGGNPPFTFEFDFGDGSNILETTNPTAGHAFAAVGSYLVSVKVIDKVYLRAESAPLMITIEEGAPPPTGNMLGLLGILGLVGIFGLLAAAQAKQKTPEQKRAEEARKAQQRAQQQRR